jgi:hypothetical protein
MMLGRPIDGKLDADGKLDTDGKLEIPALLAQDELDGQADQELDRVGCEYTCAGSVELGISGSAQTLEDWYGYG